MSNDIQPAGEASADTQATLKELAAEGNDVPGLTPPVAHPAPAAPPVPPVAPKPKDEPPKTGDTPPTPPESTPPPKVERTPQTVPVGKYNDLRHENQDLNKKLDDERKARTELEQRLTAVPPAPTSGELTTIHDVAKKLAEKHGMDEEFVTEFADEIVKLAKVQTVLPKDIEQRLKAVDDLTASNAAASRDMAENTEFENGFSEVIKEFPDLASRKEDFKQLAFTEGYEATPLRTLAISYLHDNPTNPAPTAEKGQLGSGDRSAETIDFATITEDQFKGLTDEQLDQYTAWQEKQSPVHRPGQKK